MLLEVLLLFAGFTLLIICAGWLVDGASALARQNNISELAIGLTIVAFGTSAPELVVNVVASLEQHQDIVFGNVLGSNNFNLFMILGISALITPLAVQSNTAKKEIPLSLLAAAILYLLANDFATADAAPMVSRTDAAILLVFFCAFLFYVYKQLRSNLPSDTSDDGAKVMGGWKIALLITAGLSGLVAGGKLVVDNAVLLAQNWGMSEKAIGLTIVAAGTSLPELATSVVAALKKNNDIAVGNIVGSNIFNIALILGLSAAIEPLPYSTAFNTDLYLLIAGTVGLSLAMFTGKRRKLDRWEAVIFVLVFSAYTIYLLLRA